MRTIWILGIVLLAAVILLGCTSTQQTPPTENESQSPPPSEQIAPPPTPHEQTAPTYTGPLNGSKIKLTCVEDGDCKIIKYTTGTGTVEKCVGDITEYEGVDSNYCYCKSMGFITTFQNGTETQVEKFECAHIA